MKIRKNDKPSRKGVLVMLKGMDIEKKSFEIIDGELKKHEFSSQEYAVLRRIIHATGDFDFAENIRYHPQSISSGLKAISMGKNILVDVRMVEAGINKKELTIWGGKVICFIDHEKIISTAKRDGKTRAETAIEYGMQENIGIVAIGNAPTALLKVMDMIKKSQQKVLPELIIGVPVGFVNAVESKEELSKQSYPFITILGRKGGSPIAVSIINALLQLLR